MRRVVRRVIALWTVAWCAAGVPFVPEAPAVLGARTQQPRTRGEEVIDRMLAVVAGDLIMMSDVAAAVEFGLVPQTAGPDVNRTVLSQLIDRSLMLAEVDRYAPPEPSRDAVDREFASVRERFASAESFQEALARYGVDDASLRATLRANLRLRAYLAQRFSTVPPLDGEIAEYYRRHLD